MPRSFLTSEDLIASVERRAHVPESQNTFTAEDFLALANEEMMTGLVPQMLQYHEEFFVTPLVEPLVASQTRYDIPTRSIGSKVREVFYVDNNGNLREMSRINPDDLPYRQNSGNTGNPCLFYLQDNQIVLVSNVANPSGSLQINYFRRPNQLVVEDRVATITGIDIPSGIILVEAMPSVFTSGSAMDFIQQDKVHKCISIDVVPNSINSALKTLIFNSADIPTTLRVGDTIALAGECNVPQVPDELHAVLAQRVTCRILEAQGDVQNLQFATAKLQEMEVKMGYLIDNRTEGNGMKATNLRSNLRAGKNRRRGY